MSTHPCYICKSRKNLKICKVCNSISYCSTECQRKDWNYHKIECPIIKKLKDLHKNGELYNIIYELIMIWSTVYNSGVLNHRDSTPLVLSSIIPELKPDYFPLPSIDLFKGKLFEITIDDDYLSTEKNADSLINFMESLNVAVFMSLGTMIQINIKDMKDTDEGKIYVNIIYTHKSFRETRVKIDNYFSIQEVKESLSHSCDIQRYKILSYILTMNILKYDIDDKIIEYYKECERIEKLCQLDIHV